MSRQLDELTTVYISSGRDCDLGAGRQVANRANRVYAMALVRSAVTVSCPCNSHSVYSVCTAVNLHVAKFTFKLTSAGTQLDS